MTISTIDCRTLAYGAVGRCDCWLSAKLGKLTTDTTVWARHSADDAGCLYSRMCIPVEEDP